MRTAKWGCLLGVGLLFAVGCRSASGQTVAWWRFEEWPAGTQAMGPIVDFSRQGHFGLALGSPVYDQTPPEMPGSRGLRFDGANDRVAIPDSAAFYLSSGFTIEAVFACDGYVPNDSQVDEIVFRGDDRPQLDPFNLAIIPTGQVAFAINNATVLTTPEPVPAGQTVHIAVTFSPATGEARLYLNGALVQDAATTLRPIQELTGPNPGLGIGSVQSNCCAQFFRGRIDEVRISASVLAPSAFLINAMPSEVILDHDSAAWRSTVDAPPAGWNTDIGFDDSGWGPIMSLGPYFWAPPFLGCVPGPRFAYFRAVLHAPTQPTAAWLFMREDDDADLWLNGVHLINDHDCQVVPNVYIWYYVETLIHPGPNLIAVGGDDCAGTCRSISFTLLADILCGVAPDIDLQPTPYRACLRGSAAFQVASDAPSISGFQWRRHGEPLSDGPTGTGSAVFGSHTANLVLTAVSPADQGGYDCVVSNQCGSTATAAASLNVCISDFNCNGVTNSQDFFDFLSAFFAGGAPSDRNEDGIINSQDFFDFLAAFFAGC